MALTNPSPEEALRLFQDVETSFPSQTLGDDKWYILTVGPLSHRDLKIQDRSTHCSDLYKYLINKEEFSSPEQRQGLVRRLREALVKIVSVVGVPKPIEAIFTIGELEKDEDKDYSFSREHWQSGPENQKRGTDWLAQIYRHNDAQTKDMMAAHKDFRKLAELIRSTWTLRPSYRMAFSRDHVWLISFRPLNPWACGDGARRTVRYYDAEHGSRDRLASPWHSQNWR
nr:hypothetical protein CFP56_72509 [Quercus suber]